MSRNAPARKLPRTSAELPETIDRDNHECELESAQIEIARAAVRHFALSAEVLALDTATLNLPQIER